MERSRIRVRGGQPAWSQADKLTARSRTARWSVSPSPPNGALLPPPRRTIHDHNAINDTHQGKQAQSNQLLFATQMHHPAYPVQAYGQCAGQGPNEDARR